MTEPSQHELVEEQFGPQASAYLGSEVHRTGEDLRELERLLGQHPATDALDLGTGGGHVAFLLSPRARRVVAYDLSESMIATTMAEAARRGLGNIAGQRGPVEQLPFADGSFDFVASRYSTHHWQDAAAGLREARRVLARAGRAVFMDVISPGVPLLDTWQQTFEVLRDPSHVRNYSLAEWHELLAAAGFNARTAITFRIRMEFPSWIARMRTPEDHVRAIRSMQSVASTQVRDYFQIEADGSFLLDSMLISATA